MRARGRDIDITVFGATGFVGKLTAGYLARSGSGLRIALAGRSESRLEAVGILLVAEEYFEQAFCDALPRTVRVGARAIAVEPDELRLLMDGIGA